MHELHAEMPRALGGGPASYAQPASGNELAGIWRVLVRRRMVFIATLAIVIIIAAIVTLLAPKTYTTQAKMIAGAQNLGGASAAQNQDQNGTALPILNALAVASGVQSAETYTELFQETPVADAVIRQLHLNVSPGALLGHVSVKPINNTSIISISVSWPDPKMSATIANAFAAAFVERERDLVSSQAGSALTFLTAQIPAAQSRLHSSEARLAAYESTHNIADITSHTQGIIQAVQTVAAKESQVRLDQQQAKAQLASVSAQAAAMPADIRGQTSVAPNPVLPQLQAQLAQVNVQLHSATSQYTDQHPTVIALRQQKSQLENEIAQQAPTVVSQANTVPNPVYQQLMQQAAAFRSLAQADTAQLVELQKQRSSLAPQLHALPAETARFAELQRDAKLAQDVYSALQQKFNDATIAKTTALSDVTLTQPASADEASVRPNLRMNLLLALIAGLILAGSAVYFLEYFDNTIKDEEDVARALSLPLLATVPNLEGKGVGALPWVRSLTVESFMQLGSSLRYASDRPLKTLAITSALQGDGKSTIAINTAISLAEVEGSVLLVDVDLRRPTLHSKFGIPNERGMSDVLAGTAQFDDVVRKTKHPNLDVVTSGATSPNPAKLMQSRAFDDFIKLAGARYHMVVFDCPAINAVFDGVITSLKADGTIIVASSNTTDMRALKKAVGRLEGVGVKNVLGYVLNRVTPERSDYVGYYLTSPPPLADSLQGV